MANEEITKVKKVSGGKKESAAKNSHANAKSSSAIKKTAADVTATKKTTVRKATTTKKNVADKTEVATNLAADSERELKIDYEITFKPSVLFVASEANPFAGTGGLADVIGSLPKTLAQNGNYDVRVVIPLYGSISPAYRAMMRFEGNFNVPVAWRNQYCGLFSLKYEGVTFYFIDNEYYFKRDNLYGYFDDGERFAFFSRAVLEAMRYTDYYPSVLHCHDWQSALSVIYLKTIYSEIKGFSSVRALFTIHNIEYQGKYGHELLQDLFGLPESCRQIVDYDGCINLMKGAIQLAERFSTVSRTYAGEIKNPFFAHGLE